MGWELGNPTAAWLVFYLLSGAIKNRGGGWLAIDSRIQIAPLCFLSGCVLWTSGFCRAGTSDSELMSDERLDFLPDLCVSTSSAVRAVATHLLLFLHCCALLKY